MKEKYRSVYDSLQDGLSDADLDVVERLLGVPLPDDLRCTYRIHNGQSIAQDDLGLLVVIQQLPVLPRII